MLKSPSSADTQVSLILIAIGAAAATGAVLLGIDDNPLGIALAVLAGIMFVTAFVHRWRSPRRFLLLSAVAIGVGVVAVGILIGVDVLLTGGRVPEPIAPAVDAGGNALALAVAFLVVPSMIVGLAGALVARLAHRRK